MQPTYDLDQAEETDERKKTSNKNQHTNAEHTPFPPNSLYSNSTDLFYKAP